MKGPVNLSGWERGKPKTAALSLSHPERKHSKFSASGAERWFECPGSVHLSEGIPDKDTVWSIEGTLAHEVLEAILRLRLGKCERAEVPELEFVLRGKPAPVVDIAMATADFIEGVAFQCEEAETEVETKIGLPFIHPEMFGTYDAAVISHFERLQVFDFKYGAGVPVSPVKNLQMISYALGLAYLHHWNFKSVRLWIIQPRIRGYDGPVYWDLSMTELRSYIPRFREAVRRVETEPGSFKEGPHCRFCKAKAVCPLKREAKASRAATLFGGLK